MHLNAMALKRKWQSASMAAGNVDIAGSWFPHAFIGSMAQFQRAAEGSIAAPDNSVEDCHPHHGLRGSGLQVE